MSLVVTPGYVWVNGEVETATKLNLAATPTIADGQAAVFSSMSATAGAFSALSATDTINSAKRYALRNTNSGAAAYTILDLGNDSSAVDAEILLTSSANTAFGGARSMNLITASGGIAMYPGGSSAGIFTATGLNNSPIGSTTPSTGAFTSLSGTGIVKSGGDLRMTADVPVAASITAVDLTGLSLVMAAGTTYSFAATVMASTTTTGGFLIGIYGTGGLSVTSLNAWCEIITSAGNQYGLITALTSGISATSGSAIDAKITVFGTITTNAGGTFTIRGAQGSAAGTTTFRRGSFMQMIQY